jgi:hypothetical protein
MVDLVGAVVAFLKADGGVAALAGTRVYGGELPKSESATPPMPRAAAVVKEAGGGVLGQAYQEHGDVRLDVICYGATPYEASRLSGAVYTALKNLKRVKITGVLIHWATASSKATGARDPDTDWPLSVSSWQVLVAEIPAA